MAHNLAKYFCDVIVCFCCNNSSLLTDIWDAWRKDFVFVSAS